jgi:hypothetical protein
MNKKIEKLDSILVWFLQLNLELEIFCPPKGNTWPTLFNIIILLTSWVGFLGVGFLVFGAIFNSILKLVLWVF